MRVKYVALCLVLLVAGCKSRDPNYYTLSPMPGRTLPGRHLVLKIRRPAIDVTLDRPQIVRMDNAYRITYDNAAQWSEPLDRMVERVLAQDLEARLPGSTVVTESGQLVADADDTIDLDIRQLGVGADGNAILQVVWLVSSPHFDGKPHSVMLAGEQAGTGHLAAQGVSELIGRLADGIAADVRGRRIQ